MIAAFKRPILLCVLLALCLTGTAAARADVGYVSDRKAAGVIIAVVAVGVLIGVGVYLVIHHGHSLRGCVASSAGGVSLRNEGDQQDYVLAGGMQGIKSGERIRVSGNKGKAAGGTRGFTVTRLAKDYGACPVQP